MYIAITDLLYAAGNYYYQNNFEFSIIAVKDMKTALNNHPEAEKIINETLWEATNDSTRKA